MENERLMTGKPIKALIIDDHKEHILRHRTILNDIEMRMDDEKAKAIYDHILEHVEFARSADPAVLTMTNQQQLPPAPPPPAPQPPVDNGVNQPEQNAADQSAIGQVMEGSDQSMNQEQPGMPQPASPPAPFQDNPTTTIPAEPEQKG